MQPFVIVIQGGPAVGKSTLARRLLVDLELGVISKDHIKELLYDKLGTPATRDESRLYGKAATDALFAIAGHMIAGGKSFIMESAFHKEFADVDFMILQSKYDVRFLQIYCHTDQSTQQLRYRERIINGSRHTGHLDSPDKPMNFMEYEKVYSKLNIEPCIKIDTTNFGDKEYSDILLDIKAKRSLREWISR